MKIFISMPMNGKSDKEVREEFDTYAKKLKDEYGEDTFILETIFDLPFGTHPLKYLAKSIEVLAEADIVYFAGEWYNARGCNAEYQIASTYGKAIKREN